MEVQTISDVAQYVGQHLGYSRWVSIDQTMISTFADLTGDKNWVHVDVERARHDMPDGKTIAHGLFILSLLPKLGTELFSVKDRSKGLNYGLNKVRFTCPVKCGDRIRLSRVLKSVDYLVDAARLTYDNTVEIEGSAKPALVSESIMIIYGT